jgi:hypothetical protein
VPTVEFGGLALLGVLTRRTAGFGRTVFQAGYAEAAVGLVFAVVALLWADQFCPLNTHKLPRPKVGCASAEQS